MRLSFVMPVLNEAATLTAQLARLQRLRAAGHELILVDGGSTDGSTELAAAQVDRLLVCEPGRAAQMNAGAAVATGEVLVFVHADTLLPDAAGAAIEAALASSAVAWGWFAIRLDAPGPVFRLIGAAMTWRSRLTRVCTGDQTLFVRREVFARAGGFPAIPLMEDVAISKTLRRLAPSVLVPTPVVTSARRWQRHGVLRTILFMWKLRLWYFLGRSPARLVREYYPERGR